MKQISSFQAIVLGIAIFLSIGLFALLDYTLGSTEISFSVFYMLPIGGAAWYLNSKMGYFAAVWALALRGLVDWFRLESYTHPLVPLDNTLIRASLFIGGVWALHRIKVLMVREQEFGRIDFLTELPNSRAFFEQANRELNRYQRINQPLTLAFMDCDNFKEINDQYGHQTGDSLLCLIAQTLQQTLRADDFAARLGGDEFVLLLPATDTSQAELALQRLNAKLLTVMTEKGYAVTFSIGAVTLVQGKPVVEWLLQKADTLMYAKKAAGKNGIAVEAIGSAADSLDFA